MTQLTRQLWVGDHVLDVPRVPAPRPARHDVGAPGIVGRRNVSRAWSPVRPARSWRSGYGRVLLATDLVALVVAMAAAEVAVSGTQAATPGGSSFLPHLGLGAVLALAWWASLHLGETRNPRVVGHGTEEYRRVVVATFRVLAGMAVLSMAFELDPSRAYLATALPLGLGGLLLGRKTARVRLHRRRRLGEALSRVLVVGGQEGPSQIVESWRRTPTAGFDVAGYWAPGAHGAVDLCVGRSEPPVPTLGTPHSLREALTITEADAVLVTDPAQLGSVALRELTWELDGADVELFFSPDVLDVAKTRLQLHDVSGLPMVHIEAPRHRAANRLAKAAFDRVGALVALVVFLPVLVAAALAVKLSSDGPAFYRQERVGRDGHTFDMIKFRSMRVDADSHLVGLLAAQGKTVSELPKVDNDPRVTGVGRFIRHYSIDELPQLLNVIKGDMSLVGPRPQRHFEVELYDHVAQRRLAVRPGMTGLWQVSGRSNLSFAEAIRLDVHYVENWSLTSDITILWKTVRAVLAPDGAL